MIVHHITMAQDQSIQALGFQYAIINTKLTFNSMSFGYMGFGG